MLVQDDYRKLNIYSQFIHISDQKINTINRNNVFLLT